MYVCIYECMYLFIYFNSLALFRVTMVPFPCGFPAADGKHMTTENENPGQKWATQDSDFRNSLVTGRFIGRFQQTCGENANLFIRGTHLIWAYTLFPQK